LPSPRADDLDLHGLERLPARAEDTLADVASGGRDLAQLVDELEQTQIDRSELARRSEAAATAAQRHVEQAPNEVVGRFLKRVAIAVGEAAEP
jgi:hypothetical protein